MTTGQKITELRKKSNITQEQLADLLSVSRQSVSKWESDIAYPETEKLISLSKIFKCSVDFLLKEEAESSSNFRDIVSPKFDKSHNYEDTHKTAVINKKGLPLSVASFIFAVITLIFFAVPIVNVLYFGSYVSVSFYKIVFVISYTFRSIPFLFNFLIILAILTISVLYFFFHRKALYLSLKILTTCFAFFYLLALLFSFDSTTAAFYFFLVIYVTYMIVVWSVKSFRFNPNFKVSHQNISSKIGGAEDLNSSHTIVMSQDEFITKTSESVKNTIINKKGLSLSITSMSFSVLTLILFIVPIIFVPLTIGTGTIYVNANFYDAAFSSNYQAGNVLFTLDFLILLSVLTVSVLYLFFDNRGLWIAIKVLTTCFVFFYCLILVLLFDDSYTMFSVFAVLYLVYMIIMWSIKPFRYHQKKK
ncbi:MAG: helix-turn-helix transcriptional regulator [Bacilli bacterium]